MQDRAVSNLYAVPSEAASSNVYCPEAWLASWLSKHWGKAVTVHAFEKTGVQPLLRAYRRLSELLALDSVVLVDGGVDALLCGNESSLGTPAEDLCSLAAVQQLDVPIKVVAAVGLGSEIRDGICHEQVMKQFASLTAAGGYLGVSSLVPGEPHTELYRAAVDYVFANQEGQKRSHVHKVIMSALKGEFGSVAPHVWLSPLLPLFWFFSLGEVARSHVFLEQLRNTESIWDANAIIEGVRKGIAAQDRSAIPI